MAGLACAGRLVACGSSVTLFDKGRGAGGRMATRRLTTSVGEVGFDHGAQYLTARDPGFQALVEDWAKLGVVAPWAAAGQDAWVGTPAMNAPIKVLADGSDVRWQAKVDALVPVDGGWQLAGEGIEGERYNAIVLAMPAEQAAVLLERVEPKLAQPAAATVSAPCWTVMAAFRERRPVEADLLREVGVIGLAARNSAKPGRGGTEAWVLQAGPDWSREHLEQSAESVVAALLEQFAEGTGIDRGDLVAASAHRWRYAKSGRLGKDMLWDTERRIGVCGDWLLGPRIESAWLSGDRLARAMVTA